MPDGLTGPIALFFACLLSGVLIPLPEDAALIVAGIQIGAGDIGWASAIGAASLGVLLRDGLFFGIGHFMGEALLKRPLVVRLVGAERLDRARDTVTRRGGGAVLVGRLSIGIRTSMFLVAGALGVRPRQFLFWDAVGLAITVPLWLLGGRLFGQPALTALLWANDHALWVVAAIVVFGAGGWWIHRQRAARTAEAGC